MQSAFPQKNAGWSSLVARQAHNLKVAGSNPAPATTLNPLEESDLREKTSKKKVLALCKEMQQK